MSFPDQNTVNPNLCQKERLLKKERNIANLSLKAFSAVFAVFVFETKKKLLSAWSALNVSKLNLVYVILHSVS